MKEKYTKAGDKRNLKRGKRRSPMENVFDHELSAPLPMFVKTRSLSFRFKKRLKRATSFSVLPHRRRRAQG